MEIAWIAIPLLLFIAVFGWGATLYFDHAAPPPNALEIFVVAKQWMWKQQHATGQREIEELHVPSGIPIKLVMTSQDAIHSFFVPAFRVKQDVLPGRYTILWFTATAPGEYDLFCAEYCGTDHSRMLGKIVVLEPAQYQRWLEAHNTEPTMAMRGESLFRQFGCGGCHGAHAAVRSPPQNGLSRISSGSGPGRSTSGSESPPTRMTMGSNCPIGASSPANRWIQPARMARATRSVPNAVRMAR